MATVKLKLRQSEEGFLVILTLTNREFEAEGFLAPLPPKLELSFNNWQSAYRQIEAVPQSAKSPEVINQCLVKTLRISRHVGSSFIGLYQDSAKSGEECSGQHKQLNLEALQNGEYPITRRLFVIIKQNGQVDEDAGEAYARLLM